MFYLVVGSRKLVYEDLGSLVRDLDRGLYVDVGGLRSMIG